jgi:hypothetical protein
MSIANVPAEFTINVNTQASYSANLEYLQSDGVTPVDLSGYIDGFIDALDRDGNVIFHLSIAPDTGDGVITLTLGNIALYISTTNAAGIPPGNYTYQLTLVRASGDSDIVAYGAFAVFASFA